MNVQVDEQGNIIAQDFKKLEIKGMKKSPSNVFSWPAFISTSTAKEVMSPIRNAVTARSTESVRSVLWVLIKNKIQCVPVFNDNTKKYMGFVDMFDLVQYIATAAGHSITKPDFFQTFKRMAYGDVPVSRIITNSGKDHTTTLTDSSPLGSVFDLTVSSNLHRLPVVNKQKVMGMVSQARIVQYLADHIPNLHELATRKLMDLDLSGSDNVYTVDDNVSTISAFLYMIEKGVKGLAIVNSEGKFVDSINSFDVKGLVYGDFFSDMRQPVLRYLSKARILLGRNLAPVTCTVDDTLADALQKMAQECVSRVFVIDAERRPVQAISLRDILKVLHATPCNLLALPSSWSGSGHA